MRTAKLNKSYVDTKNSILKSNEDKIKKLQDEIDELDGYEPFRGKTEAQKANIFWSHALKVLNNNG